jgi:hypothetical protein
MDDLEINAKGAEAASDGELLGVLRASGEYRAVVLAWGGLPPAERDRLAAFVRMVEGTAALELARRGLWPRAGLGDIVERLNGWKAGVSSDSGVER